MKLNFRDLKQQKFTIDAEPSDTILQVKEKIAAEKGWEASSQKLIYSGKILADANSVESYKIEEKGFIVCMVSKPKAAPAPKAAAPVPATPQAPASTPAPPAAPQQSSTTSTTAANPPATPSPAQAATAGSLGFGDQSAMMIGGRSESAIREMEAMGFDRGDAEAALRAAYYNPDRAIDYLLNGIPEGVQAEQAAQAAQRQQQQQQQQQQAAGAQTGQPATPAPAAGTAAAAPPAAATQAEEVDLFAQAAQQAQGGGNRGAGARSAGGAGTDPLAALTGGAGAGAAAGAGAGGQAGMSMDFLRNSEHFQHLRRLVQQQPAMLEPILQQVAEGNPQLAQIISQNSEAFLQLLSEDINLGEGGEQPGSIAVTQEEHDAIERLVGLGFDRQRVIQAYFACDKNEELAANFLFNETDDDFQ